jgi:hypothetical protein
MVNIFFAMPMKRNGIPHLAKIYFLSICNAININSGKGCTHE